MGPRFESVRAHQAITAEAVIDSSRMWPRGQAVKTAASHAVNVGSIPAGVTKRKDIDKEQLVLYNAICSWC